MLTTQPEYPLGEYSCNVRAERQLKNWERLKKVEHQKEHRTLKTKVVLQRELIQARDKLHEENRVKLRLKQQQLKEAKRLEKLSEQQRIAEIARQSLEMDKAIAKERRQQEKELQHLLPEIAQVEEDQAAGRDMRTVSFTGRPPPAPRPPDKGKEPYTGDNPAFKTNERISGANLLWSILREESYQKLFEQDARIDRELVNAYKAFTRERLKKHRKPGRLAKRSYPAQDDSYWEEMKRSHSLMVMRDKKGKFPDMHRLLSSTTYKEARKSHHKRSLMFRASERNKNRAEILMFNNPPPDFNDTEGYEGPLRYHPSWLEDSQEDNLDGSWPALLSQESVWRHLALDKPSDTHSSPDIPEEHDDQSERSASELGREMEEQLRISPGEDEDENDEIDLFLKKRSRVKPKYRFLTEEDARTEGRFRLMFQEKRDLKTAPERIMAQPPTRQVVTARNRGSNRSSSIRSATKSAPPTLLSDQDTSHRTEWQPLSLNAVAEYKEQRPAVGQGEFKFGMQPRWIVADSVASK
ncbi:Hypp3297 [Branchiostoma lanceolatum]|uniref:Hypp3297 protein n=1 Tax=Branchiostoma lanceolatum TaxID=7740 RepID=A0A8J9ZYQ7_BRALA|nr:Hypp3297 [Branchiostoma lanceolatum]